jgi:hypothetical protein
MHQAGTLARRSWTPGSSAIPQIIDTQGTESMIGPAWLDRLAASRMSPDQKVEHLFRAVLDRKPAAKEATAAKLVLADRMDDRIAVRELWQISQLLCATNVTRLSACTTNVLVRRPGRLATLESNKMARFPAIRGIFADQNPSIYGHRIPSDLDV